jgi:hypothetical protein
MENLSKKNEIETLEKKLPKIKWKIQGKPLQQTTRSERQNFRT